MLPSGCIHTVTCSKQQCEIRLTYIIWLNTHRDGIQDFRPLLGRRPVFDNFAKGQRVEPFPIGLDLWSPRRPRTQHRLDIGWVQECYKTCLSSHSVAPRIWELRRCGSACVRTGENDNVQGVRIDRLLDQDGISWVHECLDSLGYSTETDEQTK